MVGNTQDQENKMRSHVWKASLYILSQSRNQKFRLRETNPDNSKKILNKKKN